MTKRDETHRDSFRLAELELMNFKCFKEQSFRFPTPFTVLIGDNGVGKTAILEALSIGIGAFFLGIDGHQAPPIELEQVRLVQYELGQTLTYEPQYPVAVRCAGTWGDQEIYWNRIRKGERSPATPYAGTLTDLTEDLQEQVRKGMRVALPVIAFYSTGRLWRLPEERLGDTNTPGSRFRGYDHCLDPASHINLLMRWMKTQELISLQEKEPDRVLGAVKNAIANCVQDLEDVFYSIRREDLLATFADGVTLPFRLLSEGFRNMVAMVADIAYRAAVLNPHFEDAAAAQAPGIVLIDEIDLHLHPRWQRRVVEDLRRTFPRMQFIATTHSPFIVQSLRSGELIDLNKGPKGEYVNRSIEDIAEDVMGIELPQRSERYNQMFVAAQEYYRLLQQAKGASPQNIDRLKQKLDELTAPFSDNVAYHAFLQIKRTAAGLGDDDETD